MDAVPTIFDLCEPRADVCAGTASDSDFAADLARVLRGHDAPPEYAVASQFFANTHPTRGLKSLLANVCGRLSGRGASAAAIFRLDTSFGGGKTHGLIALVHAARGMVGVADPAEFIEPALLPQGEVRIAAFDGENADPANGRRMDADGTLAFTPWGEIAYALAGRDGYERVRKSDQEGIAPGAETIAELFGGGPALVLMDELAVYLRKVWHKPYARDQLTAFLTALFKAVECSPRAALVYTLAVGRDGATGDAYSDESRFVADRMAEAESVSARKATLLNPTEDDETVLVLRRRLFARVDQARAAEVVAAYRETWSRNREALSLEAARPATAEAFAASYPLHPDVLETLTAKTATLANFQRVRGMLRILGRTVSKLWQDRPADATAIHLHHIDPGFEPIRQEIATRLGQSMYVPALRSDVAGEGATLALAQEIDARHHKSMPPYAAYVARTVFLHSLAFNEPLKGVAPERLRYSVLGPACDISFIEAARQAFAAQSAYLDDRPGKPMRFLVEANLNQIVRREEQGVDPSEVRTQLRDKIKEVFKAGAFDLAPYPAGPWDVPDEMGDGRPLLVLMASDACSVGVTVEAAPELVARIYARKGSDGSAFRLLRNNLLFVVAEEARIDDARAMMVRRMALGALKSPGRLKDLAEHQRQNLLEWEAKSEGKLATAIQQAFRHVFYPSQSQSAGAQPASMGGSLLHLTLDTHSASERPGLGQQQVVRALREIGKLRIAEDEPNSPGQVRDNTTLRHGQMTTAALREEFRQNVKLPMLAGDEVFVKGIRLGVERGEFVYRRGTLLYGKGDPITTIVVDEQAVVFTIAYATEHAIWPRPLPQLAVAALGIPLGPFIVGAISHGDGMSEGAVNYDPAALVAASVAGPLPTVRPLLAEGVLKSALADIFA